MKKSVYRFHQLSQEAQYQAMVSVGTWSKHWVYHVDNLREYYEAFGLNYYEDGIYHLSDVLDYCETKQVHPEWVEVLEWLKSFYINLTLNTKSLHYDIDWNDEEVTEPQERHIWNLIQGETDVTGILQDDVVQFESYESLLDNLLYEIQSEFRTIIEGQIYPSLGIEETEYAYQLEHEIGWFDETGQLVGASDGFSDDIQSITA